jgi:hypothetical protein
MPYRNAIEAEKLIPVHLQQFRGAAFALWGWEC